MGAYLYLVRKFLRLVSGLAFNFLHSLFLVNHELTVNMCRIFRMMISDVSAGLQHCFVAFTILLHSLKMVSSLHGPSRFFNSGDSSFVSLF